MKKLTCLLLALVMVLGLCACGGGAKEDPNVLQAGFWREVCLPDDPIVYIAGGDPASDPSTDGVLDELAVTAIALKQGGMTYLIYTCDIVDIDGAFYRTTETAISEATGLPVEQIILNATHTHSAPTLKNNLPGKDAYLVKFNDACAMAGQKAIEDLSPAKLSYGSIMTEKMVGVRHYWMNDGSSYGNGHGTSAGLASGYKEHMYDADEECQVLRLTRDAENKKDILMVNLGAHSTMASGTNTSSLSADIGGYTRNYLESEMDVQVAYFIAAAGDATPSSKIAGEFPYGKNLNGFGEALGNYVITALDSMTDAQGTEIKLHIEDFTAKRNKEGVDDPERLAQAREVVAAKNRLGNYSNDEVRGLVSKYGFASYYEASGIAGRVNAPLTDTLPVTAMTVGDVGFVFASYEMFSEHGKKLKEDSPMAFTFIITCSEDDKAYIPSDIAFEHKFYETFVTPYAQGTGVALVERYCEILGALKDGTEVPAQVMPE